MIFLESVETVKLPAVLAHCSTVALVAFTISSYVNFIKFLEELGIPFGDYKVTLFPENLNSDGFFISKIKRTE